MMQLQCRFVSADPSALAGHGGVLKILCFCLLLLLAPLAVM